MQVQGILSNANYAASMINKYLSQVASGRRSVNTDPAGVMMGANLGAKAVQSSASIRNLQNEKAQISIDSGTASNTLSKLGQINQLAVQAQNGTLSQGDVQNIQTEIDQIVGSIDNAADLGIDGIDVTADPQAAQSTLENAQQTMVQQQVQQGAQYNAKQYQVEGLQNEVENTMAAQSRAMDANIAKAAGGLKGGQMKQMLAYGMLKQSQALMGAQVNLLA